MNLAAETGEVITPEQAAARVREIVQDAVQARLNCDVVIPDDLETTRKMQQKAYERWLMQYGCAVGTLIAYRQCGLVGDRAFAELKQEVFNTLAPTVLGHVQVGP